MVIKLIVHGKYSGTEKRHVRLPVELSVPAVGRNVEGNF